MLVAVGLSTIAGCRMPVAVGFSPIAGCRMPVADWFRAQHGDFEGGEGASGVAVGLGGPEVEGVGIDVEVEVAVAAGGVGDGALEDEFDIVDGEGFEAEEGAAADERGVDGEEGVFGGSADEGDEAALDIGEEDVLLGAGEAVNFVEEEDGAAAFVGEAAFGGGDDLADALDADAGGIFLDEGASGLGGDDAGEGGFAGSGRAVEEEGGERVGGEEPAEEFAWGEDVGLAGDLVEGARAHADGERLDGLQEVGASLGPEVGHG